MQKEDNCQVNLSDRGDFANLELFKLERQRARLGLGFRRATRRIARLIAKGMQGGGAFVISVKETMRLAEACNWS